MSPGEISKQVAADRIQWVQAMLRQIKDLPVEDKEAFFADPRNALACESCLRRALEALLDLGRHILAKKFELGVEEYKQIGPNLYKHGVISQNEAKLFQVLAGYRNRMVHFYHEVSDQELQEICSSRLNEVELVLDSLKTWLADRF